MTLKPVLDFLRVNFALIVALVFPLAGAIMAADQYLKDERDEAERIGRATAMGLCVYLLVYFLALK
jgi:hypothetical protein